MIRSLGWLALHHGLGRGLTFAFFLGLPLVLPLEAVGLFTLWYTGILVLAQPVLEMPLELSCTTLTASGRAVEVRLLVRLLGRAVPLAAVMAWAVGTGFGAPPLLLALLLLNLVLARFQAAAFAVNRGLEAPRMEGLVGAGQRLASIGLLFGLAMVFGSRVEIPAAALVGGHLLGWLAMLVAFPADRERIATILERAEGRPRSVAKLLAQGLELGAVAVVSSLYLRLDVLVLGWLVGRSEAGAYFTASRTLDAGAGMAHLIMLAALPRLTTTRTFRSTFRRLAAAMLALGAVAGVALWLLGPILFEALYAGQAGSMPRIAGHFGLVVPAVFVGFAATQGMAVSDRRRIWLALATGGLVVNLVLDLALVPTLGGLGAVWATLAAEMLVAVGATVSCLSRSGRKPSG